MVKTIGLIAAVAMPLWNIPLILKLEQRKSSKDISVAWAVGVWVCIVLMVPAGLTSADAVFRAFTVVNTILFTAVAIQVVRYR
ncbi:MAG: hypothetical protein HY352_00820 [Candidatus Omnitrophica bacterium]|nr:hypothetical protein [Candidatus Omnitrophota bacterium]